MRGTTLTFFERQLIEFRLRAHCSLRKIGKELHRDHSVIVRELQRNRKRDGKYSAVFAQELAERREMKRRRKMRKLDRCEELQKYVVQGLEQGRSPDVIAGRMKEEKKEVTICHESIYQWIYDGNGKAWYRHLVCGRQRRQKRGCRKHRADTLIPHRVSIHTRDKVIQTKTQVGHWETDSICYAGSGKQRLSVQIEKKARYVMIHRLLSGNARDTLDALRESIASVPQDIWKTITFDNGSEGVLHKTLTDEYNIATYFCDPYASWQKGQVENVNRIIRRYLPRGTDLRTISDQHIYEIQHIINNTPRKILGYKTPREVLKELTGEDNL